MLKRQRPLSPPPAPFPFFADSPDLIDRDPKRRRTAAPVLDGSARGWATNPPPPLDDDEEEYISSNDEVPPLNQIRPLSEEYKSTNTMLRELHTLHQHRLLFVSPSAVHPVGMHAQHSALSQSASSHLPATSDKFHLSMPGRFRQAVPQKGSPAQQMPLEEASRVAELYEDTNKYVLLLLALLHPWEISLTKCPLDIWVLCSCLAGAN